MSNAFLTNLTVQLQGLKDSGLYKTERVMTSAQKAVIEANGKQVINLCANNYLGLANDPRLIQAAHLALDRYGFGLSSVRFICGTQSIHQQLESEISAFLGTEDTILYSSCFDANGGVFEALFGEEDAIISDALNHASIIDGVRLSKAKRFRYANNDMADLEKQLQAAQTCRTRIVVTDGVFSMDGTIANLQEIRRLADRYDALVMVDDSHAVGFVGEGGRGTPEACGLHGKIDILTGTFGKALGGASGGYTSGKKEVIQWLRQRSRPYLFSNSVAPVIVATTLEVLKLVQQSGDLRENLKRNSAHFRAGMEKLGYRLIPGSHPIIPVMLGDARVAQALAEKLFTLGVYVIGFSYPVVPQGQARIRTQMSAAHTLAQLDEVIAAFGTAGKSLGIL
jgi:glycine C-acetyltransferase